MEVGLCWSPRSRLAKRLPGARSSAVDTLLPVNWTPPGDDPHLVATRFVRSTERHEVSSASLERASRLVHEMNGTELSGRLGQKARAASASAVDRSPVRSRAPRGRMARRR